MKNKNVSTSREKICLNIDAMEEKNKDNVNVIFDVGDKVRITNKGINLASMRHTVFDGTLISILYEQDNDRTTLVLSDSKGTRCIDMMDINDKYYIEHYTDDMDIIIGDNYKFCSDHIVTGGGDGSHTIMKDSYVVIVSKEPNVYTEFGIISWDENCINNGKMESIIFKQIKLPKDYDSIGNVTFNRVSVNEIYRIIGISSCTNVNSHNYSVMSLI